MEWEWSFLGKEEVHEVVEEQPEDSEKLIQKG